MTDTQEKELVIKGKTKRVWKDPDDPGSVLLESKDDITANDGEGHELLTGKGVAATTTTCATFLLLEAANIPTHFRGRVDERTFRAKAVTMIPIEIVMRRVAYGSFLKRHPVIAPKYRFEPVRVEFFKKDDDAGDPLMVVNPITDQTLLFEAKQPMYEPGSFIDDVPGLPFGLTLDQTQELKRLGEWTFLALERALAGIDITLVDLKIECGITGDGRIVVADVIDNDSWRIWPGGDENAMKDKQRFRDFVDAGDFSETEQVLASIGEDYHWVAAALEGIAP
ncbi:MAG: phosphoribosylaminoimidazolesuccinocarboxamide synthase [Patescibacteria group bacterium]